MDDLERAIRAWLASPQRTLVLQVGPAGAGTAFAEWLQAAIDGFASEVAPGADVAVVVDELIGADAEPLNVARFVGKRLVVVSRRPVDRVLPPALAGAVVDLVDLDLKPILSDLLVRAGLERGRAAVLATTYSPALAVADEVRWSDRVERGEVPYVVSQLWSQLRARPALLHLGRVLLLLDPNEIVLSDEWPALATTISGCACTLTDASEAVLEHRWLFEVVDTDDGPMVRPRNQLARTLFEGGIPISGSEHFSMYLALRTRALEALIRRDSSDTFVSQQLPRQAMASFSFEDLFKDAMAVLCSDPTALVREIEKSPQLVLNPGAKAVLLSSHQLHGTAHRASSLELSALRVGLEEFSRDMCEALPNRPWRTRWTRAQPVNANRVILSSTAPALAVRTAGCDGDRAVVGTSDGRAWLVRPYHDARCIWDRSDEAGEVRSVAMHVDDRGAQTFAVATSDHRVVVIDEAGEWWEDRTTHLAPLSAIAIGGPIGQPLVASSGVDGQIRLSYLRTGQPVRDALVPFTHAAAGRPIEIRCLEVVELGEQTVVVFGGVDGSMGLLATESGATHLEHVSDSVVNALSCRVEDGRLVVAVGTIDGEVRRVVLSVTEGSGVVENVPLGRHGDAVNSVLIVEDDQGVDCYAASSDRCWSVRSLDGGGDERLIEGHFGPVTGIALVRAEGRPLVVTSGGDGTCRVWVRDAVVQESLALERPTRHRGPVTALTFLDDGTDLRVWTGGSDGEVRAWSTDDTTSGRALSQDRVAITALTLRPADGDLVGSLYTGTARGEIYRTDGRLGHSRRRDLLGIAHDGVSALRMAVDRGRPVLLSAGRDGAVMKWDAVTNELLDSRAVFEYGEITDICLTSTDGHDALVVAVGQSGSVSFRALADFDEAFGHRFGTPLTSVAPLPFHRAGIVAGLANGEVWFARNARHGPDAWRLLGGHDADVSGVAAFVVGGRLVVASAGADFRLLLWDLSTRQVLQEIELDGRALTLAASSPSVAVGTTAGASVFTFNQDPLHLSSRPR